MAHLIAGSSVQTSECLRDANLFLFRECKSCVQFSLQLYVFLLLGSLSLLLSPSVLKKSKESKTRLDVECKASPQHCCVL